MRFAKSSFLQLFIGILLACLSACKPQIQPIEFGVDQCLHCKMVIADERYGAELVTKKGKVFKFDSAECMVWFLYEDKAIAESDVFASMVIDYGAPKELIPAESAFFLHTKNLPSPMGMFITAFSLEASAKEMQSSKHGEVIDWNLAKEIIISRKQPD